MCPDTAPGRLSVDLHVVVKTFSAAIVSLERYGYLQKGMIVIVGRPWRNAAGSSGWHVVYCAGKKFVVEDDDLASCTTPV
jgi:hypothetical protein